VAGGGPSGRRWPVAVLSLGLAIGGWGLGLGRVETDMGYWWSIRLLGFHIIGLGLCSVLGQIRI
jgi:hypothetical protein